MRSPDCTPSVAGVTPSGRRRGSMPIPIRLDRWIRSKLTARTARMPKRRCPLAAQSRDEPVPKRAPASSTTGCCSWR
ncbi:hypothetical protein G6F62_015194 [Rhizopus arrhizus]|nr:hypothetical protein G6F62_015194 [Rhizopus arrhizus]